MANGYLLGGRAYRSAATQPTFAQRGFIMGTLRTNGIDAVINRDGDVLGAVLDTGCATKLLAGVLVEDGNAWSREAAVTNAAFFDGLTSEEDFTALCTAVEALLVGFFSQPNAGSSTASPTSSAPSAKAKRGTRRPRAPKPVSDTVSSPTSSPSSPSNAASA